MEVRRLMMAAVCALLFVVSLSAQDKPRVNNGWRLPASAATETSPLTVDDSVIASGRRLFASKCQRCHGPKGKGDGEDAEPMDLTNMDLTWSGRAYDNPDGIVFYKIWNGRSSPRMPTFSEELSRQQAWALVAFVQTLRTAPPTPASKPQ